MYQLDLFRPPEDGYVYTLQTVWDLKTDLPYFFGHVIDRETKERSFISLVPPFSRRIRRVGLDRVVLAIDSSTVCGGVRFYSYSGACALWNEFLAFMKTGGLTLAPVPDFENELFRFFFSNSHNDLRVPRTILRTENGMMAITLAHVATGRQCV